MPVEDFYDNISGFYDDMTNFKARLDRERQIMELWIKRYHFKSALDAACGSGLHTILLNQLGVATIGVDISPKMIKRAQENAVRLGLKPTFVQSALQNIDEKLEQKFDVVLFLGNSIPHIHSKDDVSAIFNGFGSLSLSGGKLVVQLLNYDRILRQKERIVSINRNQNQEYIRFYDFLHGIIRFNVLQIDWDFIPCKYIIEYTELYPYTKEDLVKIIQEAGYKINNLFGSMNFDPFDKINSKDLVVLAEKR